MCSLEAVFAVFRCLFAAIARASFEFAPHEVEIFVEARLVPALKGVTGLPSASVRSSLPTAISRLSFAGREVKTRIRSLIEIASEISCVTSTAV